MKKNIITKRKVNIWIHKYINSSTMKLFLLCVPLIIVLVRLIKAGEFSVESILDVNILTSFLVLFVCEAIADLVIHIVEKKTEDETKVTNDYEAIVSKYCLDKKKMVQKSDAVYPVLIDFQRKKSEQIQFETEKSDKEYVLPKEIAAYSDAILNAHNQSTIYNSITIRLDDLIVNDNNVKIVYSFTSYFDTLLTNRAMDYPFKDGKTIRELYEPGPFISSLRDSQMSNHIGFNGLIKLRNDKFIFVKRGGRLSTAKRKWAPSVSASLKTKYALDDNHEMTISGIANAIRCEIEDELKMSIPDNSKLEDSIIGFYRDLVEGGKPHFVFYFENDQLSFDEFSEKFKTSMNDKSVKEENKKKLIVDGTEFMEVDKEDLVNAKYHIDNLIIKNQVLEMNPSMIASVIMVLDYMGG